MGLLYHRSARHGHVKQAEVVFPLGEVDPYPIHEAGCLLQVALVCLAQSHLAELAVAECHTVGNEMNASHGLCLCRCYCTIGGANPSGVLAEGVTVHEVMGDLVVANVPGEVTLEDAIGEGVAEFVDDGVQTGLGSVGLPTAIEDGNEVIANLSDQVTVQADLRDAVVGRHAGIGVGPVLASGDGGVHLGFDLTHVWSCGLFGMHLL